MYSVVVVVVVATRTAHATKNQTQNANRIFVAPLAALVPTALQPEASPLPPAPLPTLFLLLPNSLCCLSRLAAQLLAAVFGLRFGCHLPFAAVFVVFLVVARLAAPVCVCVCLCVRELVRLSSKGSTYVNMAASLCTQVLHMYAYYMNIIPVKPPQRRNNTHATCWSRETHTYIL